MWPKRKKTEPEFRERRSTDPVEHEDNRRVDSETSDAFTEVEQRLAHRFDLFFSRSLGIMALMGLMTALAVGGTALSLAKISNESDKLKRDDIALKAQGVKLEEASSQIQQQRYDAAMIACSLRNEQNIGIRKVLAMANISKTFAVSFPQTDCKTYAKRTVNGAVDKGSTTP